jgi:clan AA aspartic protease (TIGR02281 family)
MTSKGKEGGAGLLADIHPVLFAGVCLLFAIGGGAFAFSFDVILLGAFGTAGNFATPAVFLIVFLVGVVSPPAVLAWTRSQAQQDHRRSQALEPALAERPAATGLQERSEAQEQNKPPEPQGQQEQRQQPEDTEGKEPQEQRTPEEPEHAPSPTDHKAAQPQTRPPATLGPVVLDPTFLGRAKRRRPKILAGAIAALIAFAVGLFAGDKERFPYGGNIKAYALNRLYELAQAIDIDLPEEAGNPDSKFAALYKRLGIAPLPARLEHERDINRGLGRLLQETCDKQAIYSLGEALRNSGNSRIAANSLLGYAASCGNGEGDKYAAANILYSLADYDQVIMIMTDMIAAKPAIADYRYLRGAALAGAKRYSEALTDYANTIELHDNQRNIGEWVFLEMAEAYASLKQYCLAITPIQTWMALDPSNRDTLKTRRLMLDYSKQGDCELRYAKGSDSLPHGGGNVIRTKVSVNGVEGNFVVDTGASFVILTSDFAQRSKVDVSRQTVTIETANGGAESTLGRAATMRVGRVEAADVPILVRDRSLGREIDGLLGMSFLSRFDFSIGRRDWTLSQKK